MKINSESHHPLSRKTLLSLKRPEVLHERQLLVSQGHLDLSSSINPHCSGPKTYPDLSCVALKDAYWRILSQQANDSSLLYDPKENAERNIELLFSRGITEGIDLLIRAFCEPGHDSVLIPSPSFFMYEYWAKAHGVDIEKSRLLGESFNQVDLKALANSSAKLVFLCSPNNPVGTALTIEHIAEVARTTSSLVIVDEAYIEFANEPSAVRLIAKHPNIVVLRTFSKAWGLAGIRCGTIIAHPSIIQTLALIQGPFAIPENTQEFVARYLGGYGFIEKSVGEIRTERKRLGEALKSMRHVKKVFPSDANFLLIEFSDAKLTYEKLLDQKIIVDPAWQHIPNTIRVSISSRIVNEALLVAIEIISRQ